MVVVLHWDQFAALFGFGTARFVFVPKQSPLPWLYISSVLVCVLLFEVLPYGEEFLRTWRQRHRAPRRR
jgi:hypothetical protein